MYEQNSIYDNNRSLPGFSALNEDPFLSESEAAAYLRVSLVTMRRRRYNGTGPRYIRIGEISYRRSWLEDFIRQQLGDKQATESIDTSEPHADPVNIGNGAK